MNALTALTSTAALLLAISGCGGHGTERQRQARSGEPFTAIVNVTEAGAAFVCLADNANLSDPPSCAALTPAEQPRLLGPNADRLAEAIPIGGEASLVLKESNDGWVVVDFEVVRSYCDIEHPDLGELQPRDPRCPYK